MRAQISNLRPFFMSPRSKTATKDEGEERDQLPPLSAQTLQ
jgi:hypothetical protein